MHAQVIEISDSEPSGNDEQSVPSQRTPGGPSAKIARLRAVLKQKAEEIARHEAESYKLKKENNHIKSECDSENQRVEIERLQENLKKALDVKLVPRSGVFIVPVKAEETQDEFKPMPPDGRTSPGVDGACQTHDLDHAPVVESEVIHRPSPEADPTNADGEPLAQPSIHVSRRPFSRTHRIKDQPSEESEKTKKLLVSLKTEDGTIMLKHVSLLKTKNGKLDIWSLEEFDLGPEIKVEEKYHVGYTRKVITDSLGGNHQTCTNNWQGTKSRGIPYAAFNRGWNSQLPLAPGKHGIVFANQTAMSKFDDGTPVTSPIDIFVGNRANEWQYTGSYELTRSGEISPYHLELLPPALVSKWVKGALRREWGKTWFNSTNQAIREKAELRGTVPDLIEFNEAGLRKALTDGRLAIGFTLMKCVGYRTPWNEKFKYYEAHPKASKAPSKRSRREKKSSISALPTTRTRTSARAIKKLRHDDELESDSQEDMILSSSEADCRSEAEFDDSNYRIR